MISNTSHNPSNLLSPPGQQEGSRGSLGLRHPGGIQRLHEPARGHAQSRLPVWRENGRRQENASHRGKQGEGPQRRAQQGMAADPADSEKTQRHGWRRRTVSAFIFLREWG